MKAYSGASQFLGWEDDGLAWLFAEAWLGALLFPERIVVE